MCKLKNRPFDQKLDLPALTRDVPFPPPFTQPTPNSLLDFDASQFCFPFEPKLEFLEEPFPLFTASNFIQADPSSPPSSQASASSPASSAVVSSTSPSSPSSPVRPSPSPSSTADGNFMVMDMDSSVPSSIPASSTGFNSGLEDDLSDSDYDSLLTNNNNSGCQMLQPSAVMTGPASSKSPRSAAKKMMAQDEEDEDEDDEEGEERGRSTSKPSGTSCRRRRSTRPPKTLDEKRERNRLAAEKYRQKGRNTIKQLSEQCEELIHENEAVLKRNKQLEHEVAYLRELLQRHCISVPLH